MTVFWILFAGFAVSYGWGMRGTVIGGERGALLPGAIIGIIFAYMSGNSFFTENFYLFAATGALTMFYGGSEPYGETLGFVLRRGENGEKTDNYRKGLFGTFLKGALWIAICGGGLGMMFGALAGRYRWYDFVIVFGTLPLAQELGVLIFNKPYNKFKKVYPKVYFSLTRREEWGGNVIMLAELTLLSLIRQDYFTSVLALFGFISGGFGFMGGLLIYDFTSHPLKNGKYVFGKAQTNGFIDGWKIMEHFFGAVAGGGLALCFCLFRQFAEEAGARVAANGAWNFLGENGDTAAWVLLAMFLLIMLQYVFLPKAEKKLSEEKLFEAEHIVEIIERPFFAAFPLLFIYLGSHRAAQFACGLLIVWVVTEKCLFSRFVDFKYKAIPDALLLAFLALFFAGEIILNGYPAYALMVIYTAYYSLLAMVDAFRPKRYYEAKKNNRLKNFFGNTVMWHFLFQTAVILIIGAYVF